MTAPPARNGEIYLPHGSISLADQAVEYVPSTCQAPHRALCDRKNSPGVVRLTGISGEEHRSHAAGGTISTRGADR